MSPAPIMLHPPERVFSGEHLPTWFALTAAAGMVNIAAFLATERFVSHVTGTIAQTGVPGAVVLVEAVVIVGAFILGAMASVVPLQARRARGLNPLFHVPLLAVATLLAASAGFGALGAFGPFGDTSDRGTTLVLALLAFAMGLQNASVASTTNQVVRTTHLTGPATDLGVNLASAAVLDGEQRREALRSAGLRFGKLLSFGLGAGAMVPLALLLGWWAFTLPALIVALCALASFSPLRRNPSSSGAA